MKQFIYFILFFFGSFAITQAQAEQYTEVYYNPTSNDSLLFERSFNICDLQYLDQLIHEDFESYYDITGITNSKDKFIQTKNNEIYNPNISTKSSRELVKESLDVFLLKNDEKLYSALQNGIYKFFETTNGNIVTGITTKFSHLWLLENNKWHLKQVISFDHKTN